MEDLPGQVIVGGALPGTLVCRLQVLSAAVPSVSSLTLDLACCLECVPWREMLWFIGYGQSQPHH